MNKVRQIGCRDNWEANFEIVRVWKVRPSDLSKATVKGGSIPTGSDETHGGGSAAEYQRRPGPLPLDHRSLARAFHAHGLTASIHTI
jgi:hypothetical protein